jgi:hypothetical protein
MIYKETSSEQESDESSDNGSSLFDGDKASEESASCSESSEIDDDAQSSLEDVPNWQPEYEDDSPDEEEFDSHATVFLSEDNSSPLVLVSENRVSSTR